jgi:DNA primase
MSDIDEIKSRLNIADIIGDRVILKKAGRNFKGLCPFHNEKTPSFIVSPERQTFHCFGCGKGGSVIDFVMEHDHIDFVEALEFLADKAGVKLERRQADTPQAKLKIRILEANHLASEFYHFLLTKHQLGEKAREYLKHRGITDKSINTFMLGYSPNSWDGLLKFLHKKGYDDTVLDQSGLMVKSPRGGYDRFRGRVMFVLKDHRGNIVGFSGRLLDPNAKEAKYINTSETPVYTKGNVLYGLDVTKAAIQKTNEAIVMEGEFDVISSFQEGVSNVVAIKGSALTEGHVNLLRRYTERITFALDSDMAGDAAARRGIELAEKAGLDLKVVVLPQGKDPDEAVRENPVTFKKAISDAIPIYDYFIRSAVRRFDAVSAFGKKKISEELLPILRTIENPVVQSHYIKKVAGALDVTEETIMMSMQKTAKGYNPGTAAKPSETSIKPLEMSQPERVELYVLALVLQTRTHDWFEELKESVVFTDLVHPAVRRILEVLGDHLARGKAFLIKDFADSIPKELLPALDEAYLWDLSGFIDNDELVTREWFKVMRELHRIILKRKIKETADALRSMTKPEEDGEPYLMLQQTITKLTDELRTLEKVPSI